MIIYRLFFEWLSSSTAQQQSKELLGKECYNSSTEAWWKTYQECKDQLSEEEWNAVLDSIHRNDFQPQDIIISPLTQKLLAYYVNYRKDIITEGTELFILKQAYDKQ